MPARTNPRTDTARDKHTPQWILTDVFSHATPAATPRAVLIASVQPVGRRAALQRVAHHLSSIGEAPAQLSLDRLTGYFPAATSTQSTPAKEQGVKLDLMATFVELVEEAIRRKVSLVADISDLPLSIAENVGTRLRDAGYKSALMAITASEDHARQCAALYLDVSNGEGLAPLLALRDAPEEHGARTRAVIQLFAQRRLTDQLQVVTPQGQQLYATEADEPTGQVNERGAVYALDDFARRARQPREMAQNALRWQTLVHRLAADQRIPRDVVSQVIAWRNEAVRQAEADPEAARWLAWGRAAEAFRTLNPDQFQREFPEHGKLVERLQDAERYAVEQFPHLEDRARFLSQTRARLAERLAEGRSPGAKSPPAKPPKAR